MTDFMIRRLKSIIKIVDYLEQPTVDPGAIYSYLIHSTFQRMQATCFKQIEKRFSANLNKAYPVTDVEWRNFFSEVVIRCYFSIWLST